MGTTDRRKDVIKSFLKVRFDAIYWGRSRIHQRIHQCSPKGFEERKNQSDQGIAAKH
jgi:hypothetical protein